MRAPFIPRAGACGPLLELGERLRVTAVVFFHDDSRARVILGQAMPEHVPLPPGIEDSRPELFEVASVLVSVEEARRVLDDILDCVEVWYATSRAVALQ